MVAGEEHLVFVYGTLKTGEPNESVMNNIDTGVCRLVGKARTIREFPLIIGSKFNIPFLLFSPGVGHVSTIITYPQLFKP